MVVKQWRLLGVRADGLVEVIRLAFHLWNPGSNPAWGTLSLLECLFFGAGNSSLEFYSQKTKTSFVVLFPLGSWLYSVAIKFPFAESSWLYNHHN